MTEAEVAKMTSGEAFLLGAAFYLHDIGMAYAATPEGLRRLQSSAPYRSYMAGLPERRRGEAASIANAVAIAVRQLHAGAANDLAISEIPGSGGIYILADRMFREAWGATCGTIASSHHWTVPDLEARFRLQRDVPLPGGRKADLLYVAACLRLIDYAHINRDRASSLDRAFRFPLGPDSLVHWLAQENIDGPLRDNSDYLVYRAARPIAHIDSWWLYYEMIVGFDSEIRAVTRLLDRSGGDYKRLTLRGVRGASSPDEAESYFPTSGFLPIEVNLRTGSIDKLVELLAGETLYGPNPMAAVRELIQNARDAVMLKSEIATSPAERVTLSLPISINVNTTVLLVYLEIVDHGIGMTKSIITDYLISIASNYWTTQFGSDFPELAGKGFESAGKFGIGFLSVFMLGDEVSVESNRSGQARYRLSLRGVGRRGELQSIQSPPGSGTSVRVGLKKKSLEHLAEIDTLLPLYAPTLPHDLDITVNNRHLLLKAGWLSGISCEELQDWAFQVDRVLSRQMGIRSRVGGEGFDSETEGFRLTRYYYSTRISGRRADNIWKLRWPEYLSGNTRLIASLASLSILCLRGLAIQPVRTPGFVGVIELNSISTDVSRSRALSADIGPVLNAAREHVLPTIIENLEHLCENSMIVNTIRTLAECARVYGPDVLQKSNVKWIHKIVLPGNVEIISCSDFLAETARLNSVFLSFNLGPWTLMKKWSTAEGEKDANEIAIALEDAGQGTPDYIAGVEINIGSLNTIWSGSPKSVLFNTLVNTISQAWQVSPSELLAQPGWSHEANYIYGRFKRNLAS
jgi:hypothetical protein